VQFLDGDCELADNWIGHALRFLNDRPDVAVVCGRRRERYPEKSTYNWLCDMEWNTTVGATAACGGDFIIRADAFEAVGGFNEDLIAGEEPELCLRLREKGWTIWRLDSEMTKHDADITRFGQWWLRAKRFGYAMAQVSWLHWSSPQAVWRKELVRAILWPSVAMVAIALGVSVSSAFFAILLAYPFQIFRIAIMHRPNTAIAWQYGFFLALAKFAELQGILTFLWDRLNSRAPQIIEYKSMVR
jgi:GT2 family glycosyltransferase